MSPDAVTADRAYAELKSDLLSGRHRPGTLLNVHHLAALVSTSITPVRDVMQRLVGEGLIALHQGGGFQIPPLSSEDLSDLYRWNHWLVAHAIAAREFTGLDPARLADWGQLNDADEDALAQATTELFSAVGEACANRWHRQALLSATERLRPVRQHEAVLRGRLPELVRLRATLATGQAGTARRAMAAYHRRRLRQVARIVTDLQLAGLR